MLFALGCDTKPEETTTDTETIPVTGTETETETEEEETDPPETKEIINYVKISDKLEVPEVKNVASVKYITANLNAILKDGYGTKSLMADAFSSVFDRLVIFRTGSGIEYAYVLGKKVDTATYATTVEQGHYIALYDAAQIFGGDYNYELNDKTPKTTYTVGENGAVCEGDTGTLNVKGESAEADVRTITRLMGTDDDYTDAHFINVKDLAKILGMNVYYTDSGIICFSAGQAFDSLRGYYVAEEAAKLFLAEEKQEQFKNNMFVSIPNIIKMTENNITAYSFPDLDLNANVAAYALQGVSAKVNLGPAIVAGQGENAENYTVVRVFDIYQTCHTQFNAYPATVRGGVQVAAAVVSDGVNILTAPFTDASVKELKVYDANGAYKFSIKPTTEAPYTIAAGSFTGAADIFAVASQTGNKDGVHVEFFSAENGHQVIYADLDIKSTDRLSISVNRASGEKEGLILSYKTKAYEYREAKLSEIALDGKDYNGIYGSAFGGYLATNNADDEYKAFSKVTEYKDGATTVINAGVKENIFVSTKATKNTEYIKKGVFWHTRVEYPAPVMNKVSNNKTTNLRADDISLFTISPGGEERSKYKTQYNMWEPCSTHRWGKTAQMGYFINYVDPDTGTYAYATLTKKGERNDYLELGSSFYNATYAPNIPALDRLNFWTRRTYLQGLAELYRDAPEYTVAVSPVHEHEIDSGANSVGDYNPKMISGFSQWLHDMFGTIENVNKKYGTEFKSFEELDAPRGTKRGDWDKYATKRIKNEYFTVWALYNRYCVSRHVIQSYREAILAGFPPELIKAHQIPEGDAVAGLLGEADTRISPVDIVLADGTGYGGTRYGVWYKDKNSFFALADRSGQNNITLGEYAAMSTDKNESYKQLKYMFDNGIVFTHVMPWAGNVAQGDVMDKNEQYAIDTLQENEYPRYASSGGTGDVRSYNNGDIAYNIVEIGSKEESAGLLKSINADGSFEGTVYLQPFHAFVGVVDVARGVTASGAGTLSYEMKGKVDANGKELSGFNYNDIAELRITAKPTGRKGKITVKILHEGYEMPVAEYTFTVTGEETEYRYVFKNQVYLEDCTVVVEYEKVDITNLDATMMYEMTARKYYGETNPKAHEGGVSFDLMY